MALTRPILLTVPSFDATKPFTFSFVVQQGTSQIVANQLTIRRQSDNMVVYDEKQETFKYEHIVNADELINGTYYNAVISVFDINGNQSATSAPIQFWCYSIPTINFTNWPTNNIVTNSSYSFAFLYEQNEGEVLNSYVVNLYNSFRSLISTSGEIYVQNGSPPYSGEYLFTGLEDDTIYLIEIVGNTINNTIVSSSLQTFTVNYEYPDLFSLVEISNNCDEGYISIRSNIILIEGSSNPEPPIYIDNKEVDLTQEGSWVEWNKGYNISGDILARLWFRNPKPYGQIIQFSNISGQTIRISYMIGYENVEATDLKSYVEVHVRSLEGLEYYIFSEYIDELEATQYYNVWLTRENNIYQVRFAPA